MKPVYRVWGYFVYSVAFILLVILIAFLQEYLKKAIGRDASNVLINILFLTLFPMLIGIVIGLPSFFVKVKKTGSWKMDIIKLTTLGLPTLLFATLYYTYYFAPLMAYLPPLPYAHFLVHPTVITLNGIMFGFTLLSSIDKIDGSVASHNNNAHY